MLDPLADDDDGDRPTTLVGGDDRSPGATFSEAPQGFGEAPAGFGDAPAGFGAPPAGMASPAAPPAAPPPPVPPPPGPPPDASLQRGSVEAIGAASTVDELKAVLDPLSRWEYGTEQKAAVERAKTYISGSDSGVLAAVFVSSINEWKVAQPRVLVLSNSAYYRVTYNPKNGKIDHFNKTGLEKIRVLEKTVTGLKVYLSEQDGRTSVGKWMSSWTKKEKARARARNSAQLGAQFGAILRRPLSTTASAERV